MTDNLSDLLREIAASSQSSSSNATRFYGKSGPETYNTRKELARARKISNDNRESDQKMKKWSLIALFIFLGTETIALFALAFLQGFGGGPNGWFHLDEWCFNVVVGATLTQVATMLIIAIKHLFPAK